MLLPCTREHRQASKICLHKCSLLCCDIAAHFLTRKDVQGFSSRIQRVSNKLFLYDWVWEVFVSSAVYIYVFHFLYQKKI